MSVKIVFTMLFFLHGNWFSSLQFVLEFCKFESILETLECLVSVSMPILSILCLNVMSVQYVSLQCVTRYRLSVVISSVEIVWSLFWNVVIQSVPLIRRKSLRRAPSLTMLAGGRFWSCRCFATSKTVLGLELSKIWRYNYMHCSKLHRSSTHCCY